MAGRWFRAAADQGNPTSQYFLGAIYAEGRGIEADPIEAHKWLGLAVANASDPQLHQSASAYLEALEAEMTPEQIAEAEFQARAWQPR